MSVAILGPTFAGGRNADVAVAQDSRGPTVEFLNPSDLDANAATPIILSDRDSGKNATFRLSAWVSTLPSLPIVEFEVKQGIRNINIGTAKQIAADTFELEWDVPTTLPDGQYTLEAILAGGVGAEELDRDSVAVTILSGSPRPDTAAGASDVVYPKDEGAFGHYTPPDAPAPVGVVDVAISSMASRHFVYYTTSSPGTEPVWTQCGSATATAAESDGHLCTFADSGAASGATAIGVLANNTPSGQASNAAFHQSGDAVRIAPYNQTPTGISTEPSSMMATLGTPFDCSDPIVAKVVDQVGHKVARANVDFHAIGPTDQLLFDTFDDQVVFDSGVTVPDKGHSGREAGTDCGETGTDETQGVQGEHQIAGSPDRKHVESRGNTNDGGIQSVRLISDAPGTTQLVTWIDLDDNDAQDFSEPSAGTSIGWGQPPVPAPKELLAQPGSVTSPPGSCQRFELLARQGGASLPGASIDIHLTGAGEGAAFCDVAGSSLRQDPDQNHEGPLHADTGALHSEGRAGTDGRFIFGATAAAEGVTQVLAWIDEDDNDLLEGEVSASAQAVWNKLERTLSLTRSKKYVRPGGRVALGGRLIATQQLCSADQVVKVKSRPAGTSKRFRVLATVPAGDEGRFKVSILPRSSRDYRAVAPANTSCLKAVSRIVRVKVTTQPSPAALGP